MTNTVEMMIRKAHISFLGLLSLMMVSGCRSVSNVSPCDSSAVDQSIIECRYQPSDIKVYRPMERVPLETLTALMELCGTFLQSGCVYSIAQMDSVKVVDGLASLLSDSCRLAWVFSDHPSLSQFVFFNPSDPLIDMSLVKEVRADVNYQQNLMLVLKFNTEGTRRWYDITSANIHQYLPITLGEKVLSVPMVMSPIENGLIVIWDLSCPEINALLSIFPTKR